LLFILVGKIYSPRQKHFLFKEKFSKEVKTSFENFSVQ